MIFRAEFLRAGSIFLSIRKPEMPSEETVSAGYKPREEVCPLK